MDQLFIFAFVLSLLLFTYVLQKYYKKKIVNKIIDKMKKGIKIMYEAKFREIIRNE